MLLVEPDRHRRHTLSDSLRAAGFGVVAVARPAEVECWPAGAVVVTAAEWFTPWWRRIGATYVVVLADDERQGRRACDAGAAAWVDRRCRPEQLVDALNSVGVRVTRRD